MVVKEVSQKRLIGFGLGFIGGTLLMLPMIKKALRDRSNAREKFKKEHDMIWLAAGIVTERAMRGAYKSYDDAHMDFDFERIRLMEEAEYD